MTAASGLRRRGAQRLAEAGIDSAAADAAWLLAHVLGTEPGRLLLIDDVDDDARRSYESLIARRAERIPLQHLTGSAPFAGLDLAVGPGVFIPRPETELLVEWAVGECAARPDGPLRVADLCSGSGALALAIATAVPRAAVVAVERSPQALEYLRRNVAAQPESVARRIRVIAGDVTDPAVWERIGECELIVGNPPYVPSAAEISPEAAHDPAEAVFSGESGMDLIEAVVPLIAAALVPGGGVAVEHDDTTAAAVVAVFTTDGAFADVRSRTDLAGRPRWVGARKAPERGVAHEETAGSRTREQPVDTASSGTNVAPEAGVQGWTT
ncbi:MAG: peptide chain release factor N(5)-glutamine methyltransferase [Gordonia sp. (in: high G+C Gram-positive bacteria)]|uniref:peptide chain release factor N(5)-glutamine methyltransferase n=1 Tax=Gordonia sp. (in: high G+C Gram-positive bacteria) TaxID=84139 RepID=UPI0039E5665C